MYKGKQPASKNTTTKSYNSESTIGKKSTTVSKDRTAPKFSSFNNIIQTNQSIDMNNSRRVSNNPSPGNSMVLSGVAASGSNSKVNRKQFTNSYAANFQDKMNKSKVSKDDSLNISKRLPTNTSVNNYNSNKTITEEHDPAKHPNPATATKANPKDNNTNLMSNKSSKFVNSNFTKPPIDTSNKDINNLISSNNSNQKLLNFNLDPNASNNNNKNENNQQLQNSCRESVEYKNTVQNNFTFHNNMPNSTLKENSTTINQNTNGNVLTGPGNTNNNYNNQASIQDSSITNSNVYVNSKNSKEKADVSGAERAQKQNVYKNNSSSKIVNANLANNKADQIKKFASNIAKSKGKNNIYDLIKNTTGKKPTANSTDSKANISKKNNNNSVNDSINSFSNNNNTNNKLLGSTEIKRIPNDKENSLIGLNLNNSQNLDNLNQKNSRILNTSNHINVANSNNLSSSPVKPIKNDQNPFNFLNGSMGFSSIELLKSPKNEEEDNNLDKSTEKTTAAFNKYRNDNKQKNALSKKNSVEINPSEPNNVNNSNNLNNIIVVKENAPQEDDFNFNYNDEKIYSENQENSKNRIIEDDLVYFDKPKEKQEPENTINNNINANISNKYSHIRGKSNNYLTNEPLTSIEEIDEKHNLLNTEENAKSNKEVNSNAGSIVKQKEDNNGQLNKLGLLSKNKLNNEISNLNLNPDVDANANKGDETDKKKISLQSLTSFTNLSNSPVRKTYKNEADDQEIKKASLTNLGLNSGVNESKKIDIENPENKKPNNTQKGFNYKENFNSNNDVNSIQNMTNNISPINNDADTALKKKNSTETDLNLTPIIQLKDQNDLYKKGRVSRKSNDFADLMMLNNLIDEKLDIVKASEPQKTEKEKASPTKQSASANNLTKTTPKKLEATANLFSKAITKMKTLKESAEKEKKQNSTNIIKEKTANPNSSVTNENKTFNKSVANNNLKNKETMNNTSTIKNAKENQNSTLINKDENSFLNDLGAGENSKILNTNASVKNLKTVGNELNSSKTFNKLLSPRESAAAAITAAKTFSKQKTLGSGKKDLESKKNVVAPPGRPSLRKSVSINPNNQSTFKNNLNRTGLGNTTMNSSTLDVKKKANFISKNKLQFSKPNQSDLQPTKLSRKSILGKIMSTRNIKADDRTKNILTDIDKESFDVSVTQANQQKRPINPFNSLSRISMSSFGDSYDFNFDRKFSGTLRSDDWMPLKRRNTKSFPDKFFKGNFYKKNSMIISPENQADLQNKSFHSITGSGLCENIKIRINEFDVINRTKLKPKTKKAAKFNKGKYELIESFDASFGVKRNYQPNELCVSPNDFISLNEKDEAKEILVKPPNLRKEQKDEINQKLSEKLQGNFIDESITKITKMNRLERMRCNRYSSISVSPTRVMNNFCFSPLVGGGANANKDPIGLGSTQNFNRNAYKESDADILSPGVFSDRTLKYSSLNDESINLNNINNNNNENPVVKAKKKIGNSKVLLMDNNFVICSGDEEKVFSPFDSYIEGNNNNNTPNHVICPRLDSNLAGGAGHAEITYNNKQKIEKLERLEKISNTALNISRTNLKQDNSNFNAKRANNNDCEVVMESAVGFTIAHFDNIKNLNKNSNQILNSPSRRMRRIKALEPQNVINLFYQMHPEKNKFGFYSFANNEEDFTSNAFSLLKSPSLHNNKNLNLNPNQINKSLNHSLHISNQVSESINVTRISNLVNKGNNQQKLEINNNNFELENNQNASNTNKNPKPNFKKITFDLSENQNDNDNNNNNVNPSLGLGSEENSNLNSNTKNNIADEGYSLTFAGNSNQNNLRDAFKGASNKLSLVAEAISNSNNNNPAVQKALLETTNTLAENIRKHKENFNDVDFFDKVKNFLEAKRIQTKAVEQAYLNTDSSLNRNLKNRANLSKLEAINRSVEKANNSIHNINKSIISNANANNNNNKSHCYNPNNLVVVSSGNRNFPFSTNNIQSHLTIENNNNANNNLNSNNPVGDKEPENKAKSLKDALHRLNDLDNLDNQADSSKLVLPMNTRSKAPLRESTEPNEKNSLNEANIELLSEKLKKEKQMELLNQRFHEKLVAMKNSKNNPNINNTSVIMDNFHDFEFENFKNEFKRNNIHNGFSSKEKALNENLNTLSNLNSSKLIEHGNKKDEILISDEQLSEFKDKFLGKSEFIDKENVKLFYQKYLKGLSNNTNNKNKRENHYSNNLNNANKFKNFFSVDKDKEKEDKSAQFSDAVKKEKELSLRLEKLKNMLKIDDPKKAKELKNLNSQNFLYEKTERKNEAEIILNNLNSSNITSILNLNESKINNANYNSAGSNNNTLKLLGGLSSLKFGSNFGNSLGINNTNNAFGSSNNANSRDGGENKEKVLPINHLNVGNGVNSSKNAPARDLKFNF